MAELKLISRFFPNFTRLSLVLELSLEASIECRWKRDLTNMRKEESEVPISGIKV